MLCYVHHELIMTFMMAFFIAFIVAFSIASFIQTFAAARGSPREMAAPRCKAPLFARGGLCEDFVRGGLCECLCGGLYGGLHEYKNIQINKYR